MLRERDRGKGIGKRKGQGIGKRKGKGKVIELVREKIREK